MKPHGNSHGNDVQFNLNLAGGLAGKNKFPDSVQQTTTQLKVNRSFSYANEPNES
jgi:hypothetical protein